MFPFIRLAKEAVFTSRQPPLTKITDTHISHHICWPHDLDMFLELNNGRALTLFDLGRLAMAQRAGLISVLKRENWGLTMAGSCARFRRRIHGFERFEIRSRVICWDARFTYIEQGMWKRNGECANHVLYRAAVTDKNGLIPTENVMAALGLQIPPPQVPGWVAHWIAAEDTRPWPPMQDA